MATRRRIKVAVNLTHNRKPVKDDKIQSENDSKESAKIDFANDENKEEKITFKLPLEELNCKEEASNVLKDGCSSSSSVIEIGNQSPTKVRQKVRPNIANTTHHSENQLSENDEDRKNTIRFDRKRTESVSSTKSVVNHYNRDRNQHHRIRQISRCEEPPARPVETKKEIKSRYANPDKNRLTMFDMIYYNPTNNPMKKPAPKPVPGEEQPVAEKKPALSLTKEDIKMPFPTAKVEEVTVPQLKLGPNGEIILDEKSLTIENAKEKEVRELMANSKIQYDDEYSNNYGYYKRQKRTKDWPADETIKFYRCLHTIGTDFSLMLSLFPKRSRRDLKLKYKKEERHNPSLINKALLHPKTFNIEELETELELEEQMKIEEAALQEKLNAEKRPKKSLQIEKTKKRVPQKKVSKAMRDMTEGDIIYGTDQVQKTRRKRRKANPKEIEEIEVAPVVSNHAPPITLCPIAPRLTVREDVQNSPNHQNILSEPLHFVNQQNTLEDTKSCFNFHVTENMELEPIDSKAYELSKISINQEIDYLPHYASRYEYPPLSPPIIVDDHPQFVVPPQQSPSLMMPPPSPARSMPPQSPRGTESITLSNLSELELDSLVLVESQDPLNSKTMYEVYIMDENGEMSEKLELSPDVIENIKMAMMNDS